LAGVGKAAAMVAWPDRGPWSGFLDMALALAAWLPSLEFILNLG